MPSAAYNAAATGFSKRVQWLVEIDLDRCDEDYDTSPCLPGGSPGTDAGDGSRCWYTFGTCQDVTNFNKVTKTWRFCLNDVPWPDPATAVYPLLKKPIPIPQEINPAKLFTNPEKINLQFMLDFLPPAPDSDKTKHNTAPVGEFWRNLFARSRNYPGRPVRIYRGFYTPTFVLSDFEQVGPDYTLRAVKFSGDTCTITGESPLAELNRREIPFTISEDNTVRDVGGINDSVTTVTVNDASEYPDPADYTRNTCYIEIESEIISYTTRNTGPNTLTGLTRGAFGTLAATHVLGEKVSHVACFGDSAGEPDNCVEVIQDSLEWAGIAAADVDTSSFDDVKDALWPNDDVSRVVRKPKKVAKLIQQIRELRDIAVYIAADGQWECATTAPTTTTTDLDDDYFLDGSVSVLEDEETRVTRVALWYDPSEDNASESDDYGKGVIVIDTDLEQADNFGDVKEDTVLDSWLDADTAAVRVREIARRIITRRRHGIRTITFSLDVKDSTLNVGDRVTVSTRHITDIYGTPEVRPGMILSKREKGLSEVQYTIIDTNYGGKYLVIGPDTMTSTYDSATAADKVYGYWGDADNRLGTAKEEGYVFF